MNIKFKRNSSFIQINHNCEKMGMKSKSYLKTQNQNISPNNILTKISNQDQLMIDWFIYKVAILFTSECFVSSIMAT